MTRALLIACLCALLPAEAWAAGHRAKQKCHPAMRSRGHTSVTYVTAELAYLDRGSDDGLVEGQLLSFRRGSRPAGKCRVQAVAESFATCKGATLRDGDLAAIPGGAATKAAKVPHLAPPPSPAKLRAERAQVVASEVPRVSSAGASPALDGLRLDAELAHEAWVVLDDPAGAWQRERLGVAIRGLPIGGGVRLYADATAYQWTERATGTQLFVRELAFTRREGGGFVFSAGRVWPYDAAGLGMFDGIQAGWSSPDGVLEAGAFVGTVPYALNTAPDFTRPIAGAYASFNHRSDDGFLHWLQQEVHAAVQPDDRGPGTRIELESLTRAWFSERLDGGLDVRVTFGPDGTKRLDAARADVGFRLTDAVRVAASVRYDATPLELLPSVLDVPDGHRSLHADAAATWDAGSWLCLGITAGGSRDLELADQRAWVGPEVCAPRLFDGRVRLAAGYQEELGWMMGRSGWVSALVHPVRQLDLFARASWAQTGTAPLSGDPWGQEVGGYGSVRWALTQNLSLRLSGMVRQGLQDGATGITTTGSLAGSL